MRLWISRQALAAIADLAEQYAPLETGGVLLGWRRGADCVVSAIVGPGPRALHGGHMFLPDHAWQIERIDAIFAASNGDLDYLGDWHTHPDGSAALSALDRKTLKKLGRKTANAIMAIAAPREARGWSLTAWHQPKERWMKRVPAEACDLVDFDLLSEGPDWMALADTPRETYRGGGAWRPISAGPTSLVSTPACPSRPFVGTNTL